MSITQHEKSNRHDIELAGINFNKILKMTEFNLCLFIILMIVPFSQETDPSDITQYIHYSIQTLSFFWTIFCHIWYAVLIVRTTVLTRSLLLVFDLFLFWGTIVWSATVGFQRDTSEKLDSMKNISLWTFILILFFLIHLYKFLLHHGLKFGRLGTAITCKSEFLPGHNNNMNSHSDKK